MPARTPPDPELVRAYDEAERAYYRSLDPEDTIDPVCQATTRAIVLSNFGLIRSSRPDIQCFNELLIRYPRPDGSTGRAVPNNFVVMHPEPVAVYDSFDTAGQPAKPLLVIDYITELRNPEAYKHNPDRYGRELRVPYYLVAYPEEKRFTLYRLTDGGYADVPPNESGRFPVPELEVEVGMHDGWMRFWFGCELVKTPAEMYQELQALRAEHQTRLAVEAEIARLREELARVREAKG